MSKIEVRLNPDTPPTGTDLSVVNAARRSFNTRSNWDFQLSHWKDGPSREELESQGYEEYDESTSGVVFYKLKEKDKRLIEFLARGMTADDFGQFRLEVGSKGLDWMYYMDNNKEQELVDLLWQWRNTPTHDTPFNHTFISFEVKAPIFVRAQLVKHEYLIMSEFSRRYITDGIEFYEPDYWRKAAPNKKQGSLEKPVDELIVQGYDRYLPKDLKETMSVMDAYFSVVEESALSLFKDMVNAGVAPEQARMVLPQSTMTEWTWSGTLGAFAKMCQLRLHPEAQYEARLVAQEVYKHLKEQWPVSAQALVEGVF